MALPADPAAPSDPLVAVYLGHDGAEARRTAMANGPDLTWLRRVVGEALALDAPAIILVLPSVDDDCRLAEPDFARIETVQQTLRPLGIRLHDYLLWRGERCVSWRLGVAA